MTNARLADPLPMLRGPALSNRLVLAPMTNLQSHPDGRLSDDEYHWLTMRAQGGFGLTMTCAAHVQAVGQGFPGQLGVFGDEHIEGLTRLAAGIKAAGSVASIQLHHAGIRADKSIVAQPVGPSDDAETGSRGLTTAEVEGLRDDFIAAAKRAEQAGFDGVEVHGAHGYVLAQFLSAEDNRRDDLYGGSFENRARLLFEVIHGIRAACGSDFQIGLRLSPERFGQNLGEVRDIAAELCRTEVIDYLDLSLWDVFKDPQDEAFKGRSLLGWFTDFPRGKVRLGAAGKIQSAADAARAIDAGCDFVLIGKAAILHHDFARRALADPAYTAPSLPVTAEHLAAEGLGKSFIGYMSAWPGFVAEKEAAV